MRFSEWEHFMSVISYISRLIVTNKFEAFARWMLRSAVGTHTGGLPTIKMLTILGQTSEESSEKA